MLNECEYCGRKMDETKLQTCRHCGEGGLCIDCIEDADHDCIAYEDDLDCKCECHHTAGMMHCFPCCQGQCEGCGRYLLRLNHHRETCVHWLQWAAKQNTVSQQRSGAAGGRVDRARDIGDE